MFKFSLCLIFALLAISSEAKSCPKKIAAVSGDEIAHHALPILMGIYQEAGCTTSFFFLPGRRGILSFNRAQIDGELYRNPIAEQFYQRAFIRSKHPLITVQQGIFTRTGQTDYTGLSIGYISGIKWHDMFVQNKREAQNQFVRFDSMNKLFSAYNKGQIEGFLSSSLAVRLKAQDVPFPDPPQFSLQLGSIKLYHYLGREHAGLMQFIDRQILKNNPFADITD